MKRALLFGDYDGKYHPMAGIPEALAAALPGWELMATDKYPDLTTRALSAFDAVFDYANEHDRRGNRHLNAALLGYVAAGGGLVGLHCGIIAHSAPEYEELLGGKFTGHPAACDLPYTPSGVVHPVLAGVEPFTLFEEPYRIDLSGIGGETHLLGFAHEGADYPAAWARMWGLGKVVYLSMGHTPKSYEEPGVQRLLLNSAEWVSTPCPL